MCSRLVVPTNLTRGHRCRRESITLWYVAKAQWKSMNRATAFPCSFKSSPGTKTPKYYYSLCNMSLSLSQQLENWTDTLVFFVFFVFILLFFAPFFLLPSYLSVSLSLFISFFYSIETTWRENKKRMKGVSTDSVEGENVTLEDLKQKMAEFAKERNWDQFHSPRNLLLALVWNKFRKPICSSCSSTFFF